jgi:hypothetical protein
VGAESVPRRINQGRELSPGKKHGDAQLFGQSRTLRIKQLLGLTCAMANLDLAAPSAAILPKLRFSCSFAGLQAQLQPVAEIVPNTQPDLIQESQLTGDERRFRIPASHLTIPFSDLNFCSLGSFFSSMSPRFDSNAQARGSRRACDRLKMKLVPKGENLELQT